ncbi:MAG: substrate-binding domain-containing protein [Rubrivivax sp.]|jgi:molybdate transport system substrate-binding protein|nr:substrate-binding domain-containing protein [Rubrivivax sp.]
MMGMLTRAARRIRVIAVWGAAGTNLMAGCAPPARAADLRVLTAGAYKQVLQAAQPAFERETGHRLVIDNDTAGGLVKRVNGGEAFDLLVLTAGPLAELARTGAVRATGDGAPRPLTRVGIGVAVKQGASKPDIGSVPAFRDALLAARAIATVDPAAGGTSGIHLWRTFEAWGIADRLRPRAVLVPGGYSAAKVVSGEADIAVQQMSELVAVPGVTIVGMVPDEIQVWTVYAGAVSARARQAEAAVALWRHLAGPAGRALLVERGMAEP